MRIGLDVMGGDNAPKAILEGALAVADRLDDDDTLVLVGDEKTIRAAVDGWDGPRHRIDIVATTEVIGMDESPVEAVRTKLDSSIVRLSQMAGRKAADPLDAIISAGNTGAKVTGAQMYMRRLPNVARPGIAVTIPTFSGPVVLVDVGANIEPKPHHLAQYGVMGETYARLILGIENPRIGLMNVGGEEQKGTHQLKEARDRLRSTPDLNFIGYVEGRGVFDGDADVVVTDGIVGNVMLKLAEGLSSGIFRAIATEVQQTDPELAIRFAPIVKSIYKRHDYHEYGGAPLLGVNGCCLICHGSSEARTILNAVLRAKQYVLSGMNAAMVDRLAMMEPETA
jgi:glycerol-3-phosphate acyltransferase PlsX